MKKIISLFLLASNTPFFCIAQSAGNTSLQLHNLTIPCLQTVSLITQSFDPVDQPTSDLSVTIMPTTSNYTSTFHIGNDIDSIVKLKPVLKTPDGKFSDEIHYMIKVSMGDQVMANYSSSSLPTAEFKALLRRGVTVEYSDFYLITTDLKIPILLKLSCTIGDDLLPEQKTIDLNNSDLQLPK